MVNDTNIRVDLTSIILCYSDPPAVFTGGVIQKVTDILCCFLTMLCALAFTQVAWRINYSAYAALTSRVDVLYTAKWIKPYKWIFLLLPFDTWVRKH
jgi:hypothetical protein